MRTNCSRCVLDTTVEEIRFDDHGVCNYCREYSAKSVSIISEQWDDFVSELRKRIPSSSRYDFVVGISGGTDSSYLLYRLVSAGFRPLAVHCDMGWNTEGAVSNIEKLIKRLNVDLVTRVIDWEEFRDVQLAYLRSGVLDLEIPTDHAFVASLYEQADRFGLRHILTGHNFATEGLMPHSWVFDKGNAVNLIQIHRRYGGIKKLRSFPILNLWRKFYFYNVKRIENIHPLDRMNYSKRMAEQELAEAIDWRPHPMKHGEVVFTRFYQCFILPRRFNIDKRKAHYSNTINSGEMSREEALRLLREPVYAEELYAEDRRYVLKKLGLRDDEFERLMDMPIVSHQMFGNEEKWKGFYHLLRTRLPFGKRLLNVSRHW